MFYYLAALFILLPTYTIRFHIGPLPVDLLEILCVFFLGWFAYWLETNSLKKDFFSFQEKEPAALHYFIGLFVLAGLISAIVNHSARSFGLFTVWFLFPVALYYPIKFILQNPINKARFVQWILIVVGLVSLYGIIQYFTLVGLPSQWWGNSVEPKRILSIFEYPNAFGLWLAPLLAFLLPFIFAKPSIGSGWKGSLFKICYLLGLGGLLLSLSRGSWFGFLAAVVIFAFIGASKKARLNMLGALAICALIIAVVPNLRYRVILPFKGDKSSVSRISLWQTGEKMIASSPIFGKGLNGFADNFNKYNTDPNLAPINFPHNIFLNFWVETGLLGLISFLGILVLAVYRAWKFKGLANIGVILFIVALLVHGQIDAPYFKNDLALLFWIILAMLN